MTLSEMIRDFVPSCEQEQNDKKLILQYLLQYPNLLTRENETMHFTASAWVTDRSRERVLMAYHNLYRSWAWLGGHADGQADLCAAAARELSEESGLREFSLVTPQIFSLEILSVDPHFKRGKFVSAHLHLNLTFLFEADPQVPVFSKPDENSAVRWLTAQEINDMVSEPEMLVIYQKLIAKSRLIGSAE